MPYLILKIDPDVRLSANWLASLEATDGTFANVYAQLATDSSPHEDGRLPITKALTVGIHLNLEASTSNLFSILRRSITFASPFYLVVVRQGKLLIFSGSTSSTRPTVSIF